MIILGLALFLFTVILIASEHDENLSVLIWIIFGIGAIAGIIKHIREKQNSQTTQTPSQKPKE